MPQYSDIVITPIYGPLSTNNTANGMNQHNFGVLKGLRPTPPQFFPSQEPIYADENTNSRQIYKRTVFSPQALLKMRALAQQKATSSHYTSYSSQRQFPVPTLMNYIAPLDSSLYINRLKATAIGKSAYSQGQPNPASYSITTKNVDKSFVRSATRRARSSGSVAPKKKGALENKYLCSGKVCGGLGTNFANQTY
jgi:hypothetical protein